MLDTQTIFALQIILTFLTVFLIAFGLSNLNRFYQQIWCIDVLRWFYISSLLCLCFNIWMYWLADNKIHSFQWLLIYSVIRNSEACYSWCQCLAFIRLSLKLKHAGEHGIKPDSLIQIEDATYTRITKIALISGLIFFNSAFLIYVIVLICKFKETNNVYHLAKMEIFCWVMGLISSVLLLSAILYTILKVRSMFPGRDNPEAVRIGIIALIFGLSFIIKSLYEWTMFFLL